MRLIPSTDQDHGGPMSLCARPLVNVIIIMYGCPMLNPRQVNRHNEGKAAKLSNNKQGLINKRAKIDGVHLHHAS